MDNKNTHIFLSLSQIFRSKIILTFSFDTTYFPKSKLDIIGEYSAPGFIGEYSAPGFIGEYSAPGFIGEYSAPGFIGEYSAPGFIGEYSAPGFIGWNRTAEEPVRIQEPVRNQPRTTQELDIWNY